MSKEQSVWSYVVPTVQGWYWWQSSPTIRPVIVALVQHPKSQAWYWHTGGHSYNAGDTPSGRWSERLRMPDAQEVWELQEKQNHEEEGRTKHEP